MSKSANVPLSIVTTCKNEDLEVQKDNVTIEQPYCLTIKNKNRFPDNCFISCASPWSLSSGTLEQEEGPKLKLVVDSGSYPYIMDIIKEI